MSLTVTSVWVLSFQQHSTGDYKHWTQDQGPGTQGSKDPESGGLCCIAAVTVSYTNKLCLCYKPKSRLRIVHDCHPQAKASFIADNTVSNYTSFDFFDPQCSLLSVLQSQSHTHKARGARESQGRMHVTLTQQPLCIELLRLVVLHSTIQWSIERIKEARRQFEIAQSGVKSIFCV